MNGRPAAAVAKHQALALQGRRRERIRRHSRRDTEYEGNVKMNQEIYLSTGADHSPPLPPPPSVHSHSTETSRLQRYLKPSVTSGTNSFDLDNDNEYENISEVLDEDIDDEKEAGLNFYGDNYRQAGRSDRDTSRMQLSATANLLQTPPPQHPSTELFRRHLRQWLVTSSIKNGNRVSASLSPCFLEDCDDENESESSSNAERMESMDQSATASPSFSSAVGKGWRRQLGIGAVLTIAAVQTTGSEKLKQWLAERQDHPRNQQNPPLQEEVRLSVAIE